MKNYMKEQNNKCCKEVSKKKKKNSTLTAYVLRLRIRKTVQGAYDYEKQNYIQQKQPPKVFCKKGILRILQNF